MQLIALVGLQETIAPVVQQAASAIKGPSSASCSVTLAHGGNATLTCVGVEPSVLRQLNAEFNRRKLSTSDRVREADEWARKYKELETLLTEATQDKSQRLAMTYLQQGDLSKASDALTTSLGQTDVRINDLAANNFTKATILELSFKPKEAIPFAEMAYRLRPNELKYGQEYGQLLLRQNDFVRAEPVLIGVLTTARQLAQSTPGVYLGSVARTLNDLGQKVLLPPSSKIGSLHIYRLLQSISR